MSEILEFTAATAATAATERQSYAPRLVLIRIDETFHYKDLFPKELKAASISRMWGMYLVDLDSTVPDPCFPTKFPVRYEAWTLPDVAEFKSREPSKFDKNWANWLIENNMDDEEIRYFSKRQVSAFPARNKKKVELYGYAPTQEFEMPDDEWFAAALNKKAHDHLMREAALHVTLNELCEW